MLAGPREAEHFRRCPKGGGSRTLPKVTDWGEGERRGRGCEGRVERGGCVGEG